MMKGNIEKKPKRKDIFSKLNFKLNLGGEDPGKNVKRRTHWTFVSAPQKMITIGQLLMIFDGYRQYRRHMMSDNENNCTT